ncbi:MAG: hypothetical protein IJZ70_01005 [Bacteroidales bacterium]|nr:hypothetical protein [Bacteroidales bacterium]
MIDKNIWTSNAVVNAVIQDSSNLEIVLNNYFKAFIERLNDHNIALDEIGTTDILNQRILEGINNLEEMRKEFLNIVEIFANSNNNLLENHLPVFIENLLNNYEEKGINLYTDTNVEALRNDHYRFFNQFLIISLTALLIENKCFNTLKAILHSKYKVYYKSYRIVREVNFIRLRGYNYTLNEYLNTGSPKRISVTADFMLKFSSTNFASLVRADILLYYISLWQHTDNFIDRYWFPELSVYNRDKEILPYMVSQSYFDNAKVLFNVNTIEEYRNLLSSTEDILERNGIYRVPLLKDGLLYNTVGNIG